MPGFLEWALPRLGLRWEGFRRNQRQVSRRIAQRRRDLDLGDVDAYRAYLETHPEEWTILDGLCRITISRFARDRPIWDQLVADVLPRLGSLRAWSAGCGAGEEPYTIAIAASVLGLPHEIVATDVDEGQLARARVGCYPTGALRELPDAWRELAFDADGCLREAYRPGVRFERRDVRGEPPAGPFDLVLCRNLAFTYLDEAGQRAAAATFRSVLRPGGVLVVGKDEVVPSI